MMWKINQNNLNKNRIFISQKINLKQCQENYNRNIFRKIWKNINCYLTVIFYLKRTAFRSKIMIIMEPAVSQILQKIVLIKLFKVNKYLLWTKTNNLNTILKGIFRLRKTMKYQWYSLWIIRHNRVIFKWLQIMIWTQLLFLKIYLKMCSVRTIISNILNFQVEIRKLFQQY